MSCWHCGSILVSDRRGGRFEYFYHNDKYFYRPQRSWAKVMFLQASVILSTGGVCLSAFWDASPPARDQRPTPLPPGIRDPPPDQADPPPGPGRHPPGPETPPEADASIRSMSGRYASYWNAFLLVNEFSEFNESFKENSIRLRTYCPSFGMYT